MRRDCWAVLQAVPAGSRFEHRDGVGAARLERIIIVEYVIYGAVVLAGIVLCTIAIRSNRPLIQGTPKRLNSIAEINESSDASAEQAPSDRKVGLEEVRTPWGWPGSVKYSSHQHLVYGEPMNQPLDNASGLHQWVDHLVSSKPTIEDEGYRQHREMCLRALLEDRFHNSTHPELAAMGEGGKVRSPKGPTVTAGGPGGPGQSVRAGFGSESSGHAGEGQERETRLNLPLSELRTPWGW